MTSTFFACTFYPHAEPEWTWPASCPAGVSRMYGQIEECPSTGKPHYQFVVITASVCRATGVKKLLGSRTVHVEVMRKCLLANDRYVGKESTRIGTLPELKAIQVKKLHPIDWLLTHHTFFNTKTYSRAVSYYYDPEYRPWFDSRPWLDVNATRLTEEELATY